MDLSTSCVDKSGAMADAAKIARVCMAGASIHGRYFEDDNHG